VLAYKKKVRGWLGQAPPPSATKVAQLRTRLQHFEETVHRRLAF
jgi:hypothetical protein